MEKGSKWVRSVWVRGIITVSLHIAARYNNMGAVRALLDDGGCDVIALSEGTACVSAGQLALALGHV